MSLEKQHLRRVAKAEKAVLEARLAHAEALLRASLNRFERLGRNPVSDRLAFEIMAYLGSN
jgi:hypothetical protein